MAKNEYAVECFKVFHGKTAWFDAYATLGDARRAAKEYLKDKGTGYSCILLKKEPRPIGHNIGATWQQVGVVNWKS